MKKNILKIIIVIIAFILGIAIGFCFSKNVKKEQITNTTKSSYIEKIRTGEKNTSDDFNKKLNELDKLIQEENELDSKLSEIRAAIGILENEIDNETDRKYTTDIYPPITDAEENETKEDLEN